MNNDLQNQLITKKPYILQIFCKHEYVEAFNLGEIYFNLSGKRIYTVCQKCGKVKSSYFVRE